VPARLRRLGWALAAAALVVLTWAVARQAWVSDDAFITFRQIDNWQQGHGLVWNGGYRVQAYTHPLWMLLLAGLSLMTRELFFTSMAAGLGLTVLTLALCGRSVPRPYLLAGVTLALSASSSFVDFATSGLENPLTHLLLWASWAVFLRREVSAPKLALTVALGSLLYLSRPDAILLAIPASLAFGASCLRALGWRQSLRAVAIGALPFLLWEAFSVFYYASLVPNTAYAKLGAGVPRAQVLEAGARYLKSGVTRDPVAGALLAAGALASLVGRDRRSLLWMAGAALYLGYVGWIGGDFMQGRFFAGPIFVSVLAILGAGARFRGPAWPALVGGVVLAALSYGHGNSPWIEEAPEVGPRAELVDEYLVADERAHYREWTSIQAVRAGRGPADHVFAIAGRRARENHLPLVADWTVGLRGYYAGPDVYVLDELALADPLLARLPAVELTGPFKAGHLPRAIPEGYRPTLVSGENRLADPAMRAYWAHLHEALTGELWSGSRVAEALAIAFGRHRPPGQP